MKFCPPKRAFLLCLPVNCAILLIQNEIRFSNIGGRPPSGRYHCMANHIVVIVSDNKGTEFIEEAHNAGWP